MSTKRAITVALVSACLSAPASAAGAAWQPPRDVSRPTAFFAYERIAFDGSGNAVAWWFGNAGRRSFADPTSGPGAPAFRVAVRPRGSDSWRREVAHRFASAFAPFGKQRAYAIEEVERAQVTVRAHTLKLDGRRIRTQNLQVTSRMDSVPSLSANTRGDAVAAWTARVDGRQRVFAALARRGGRFGKPVPVSAPSPVGRPVTAIGPGGDALVAWAHRRAAVHAVMAPAARSFRPRERVGSTENGNEISAAVGADGAAIAWTSRRYEGGDGGGPVGPASLRVSYATPGRSFELRGTPAEGNDVTTPRVAFDSNRNAVVVWRDGTAIRWSQLRPASMTPGVDIVPSGTEPVAIQSVTAGPRGRALVLWIAGDTSFTVAPTYLRASFRPDISSPFGPPETVAPTSEDLYNGAAALDPRTGDATAIWRRELGGTRGRVLESSIRR